MDIMDEDMNVNLEGMDQLYIFKKRVWKLWKWELNEILVLVIISKFFKKKSLNKKNSE